MHYLPLLQRQTVRNSRSYFKTWVCAKSQPISPAARQVDINLGLTQSLAQCFHDRRQPVYVDHSVRQLLAQRLYGLALG